MMQDEANSLARSWSIEEQSILLKFHRTESITRNKQMNFFFLVNSHCNRKIPANLSSYVPLQHTGYDRFAEKPWLKILFTDLLCKTTEHGHSYESSSHSQYSLVVTTDEATYYMIEQIMHLAS